jgi:hypothetical protein
VSQNIFLLFIAAVVSLAISIGFRPKDSRSFGDWWSEEGFAVWLIALGIIATGIIAFGEFEKTIAL